MLSSLKSYIVTQLFRDEKDSGPSQIDKQLNEDSVRESAEHITSDNNESFVSGFKEILSFASESSAKLAVGLKSTAKHISDRIVASKPFVEFDRAHSDFVAERSTLVPEEDAFSTKVLYSVIENGPESDEESQKRQQRIKKQVLRLSMDEQNFLRPPPHGSCFRWSPQLAVLHMPLAMALLNEDGNLASMRFKLVPRRVKEDDFWRNYFYRVSLIRLSENLPGEIYSLNETSDERKTKTDNIPKDGDSQQKQSSKMSSPAALSLSSDSVDEIEAELMLEESDLENTVVIDEELENEILAELDGLGGKRDPIPP